MKSNHLSRSGSIRRWLLILPAVVVALPVIVFFGTETRYDEHLWLRVSEREEESKEERPKYRAEQMAAIRSDSVLNAALKKQGIAELNILKNKKDKKAWLAESLEVKFLGGSEILQISISEISAKNCVDAIKILLALRSAYMDEVAVREGMDPEEVARRRIAWEALADKNSDMWKQITAKTRDIENLSKQPEMLESPELAELIAERDRMKESAWEHWHEIVEVRTELEGNLPVQPIYEHGHPRPKWGIRGFGK